MELSGRADLTQQRSISGLWTDLFWFAVHSIAAVGLLVAVVAAISFARPNGDARTLKLLATGLAFVVPLLGALVLARVLGGRNWLLPARFAWVSGLLVVAAAAVWVIGLPTGPGLCEGCGTAQKLWRTFLVVQHGSGLMAGDGLLVGCWVPLALAGYSLGASLGLRV